MAPPQRTNGHPVYKWKKARLWQVWMEEASCTLCKVALGRDDVLTVRGQNCGGRVCMTCAENANTARFPPKIGTVKVIGGSWDGLVAGAGHHNKGPLF